MANRERNEAGVNRPEEIRLRALYRRTVMRRGISGMGLAQATRLVGPDCAFHLYAKLRGACNCAGPTKRDDEPEETTERKT